ncbi:LysR family transcriptional regulator [Frigidibacter sp. MR17.14]|uniref:LysR family transcriptional regulator n=1 Tax=Frigidibacter sp. MR17.14 TaxID=3126509 RepID=UPI003012F9E3
MPDLSLSELRLVAEIVEGGSFRAASIRLDVPPSTISRRVATLEARLDLRLFNRTTRSLALTDEGRAFLDRALPALAELEAALTEASGRRAAPGGLLRINGSAGGLAILLPLVLAFRRLHPSVRFDLVEDGQLSDIVGQGFDAGLRLAEDVPADMIAAPVGGPQRFIVVATPALVAEAGRPSHPSDLDPGRCLGARLPSGRIIAWEFAPREKAVSVHPAGPVTLGDTALALEAARGSAGFAYVTERMAAADHKRGALVTVLDDWCPSLEGLRLYCPRHRNGSVTLRAFAEFLRRQAAAERSAAISARAM